MDNSWLDSDDTKAVLLGIKEQVGKWKDLQKDMLAKQTAYEIAKDAYDEHCKQLCALLRQNGLETLRLETGEELTVQETVKCSVKKDEESKQEVADWLREQGMEQLVDSTLTVMPSNRSILDSNGVAYDEEVVMNTNKIKAYVKSEMEKGNLSRDELPAGLSWYVFDTLGVK